MAQPDDFAAFLTRVAALDFLDIAKQVNAECARAEGASYGHQPRKLGSTNRYAHRIKEFLFFLQNRSRPGSASDADFARYQPVVQALVRKGQLAPEFLQEFEQPPTEQAQSGSNPSLANIE
jgi:hypothetical protein